MVVFSCVSEAQKHGNCRKVLCKDGHIGNKSDRVHRQYVKENGKSHLGYKLAESKQVF